MMNESSSTCRATICGYRCDREKDHGVLHHHPEPNALGHDDWWILWPHGGYRLISDCALPKSGYSGPGDPRIFELMLEQLEVRAKKFFHKRDDIEDWG